MANFIVDRESEYVVKVPKNDLDWIRLGQSYVAYENTLPPAEQLTLPTLTSIFAALNAAETAANTAAANEHTRAGAATTFSQLIDTVEKQLRWVVEGRARQFTHNLALLEAWGVDTVLGVNGLRIIYPTVQDGWLALLNSYITHEESLPVEQQWTDPPLSDMETLREQVQEAMQNRDQSKDWRKLNIIKRRQQVAQLRLLLNLAQHALIVDKFDGKVTMDLRLWGFDVIYRKSNGTAGNGVTEPEEPETELTASEL